MLAALPYGQPDHHPPQNPPVQRRTGFAIYPGPRRQEFELIATPRSRAAGCATMIMPQFLLVLLLLLPSAGVAISTKAAASTTKAATSESPIVSAFTTTTDAPDVSTSKHACSTDEDCCNAFACTHKECFNQATDKVGLNRDAAKCTDDASAPGRSPLGLHALHERRCRSRLRGNPPRRCPARPRQRGGAPRRPPQVVLTRWHVRVTHDRRRSRRWHLATAQTHRGHTNPGAWADPGATDADSGHRAHGEAHRACGTAAGDDPGRNPRRRALGLARRWVGGAEACEGRGAE